MQNVANQSRFSPTIGLKHPQNSEIQCRTWSIKAVFSLKAVCFTTCPRRGHRRGPSREVEIHVGLQRFVEVWPKVLKFRPESVQNRP